jgi:hypothetical protein
MATIQIHDNFARHVPLMLAAWVHHQRSRRGFHHVRRGHGRRPVANEYPGYRSELMPIASKRR